MNTSTPPEPSTIQQWLELLQDSGYRVTAPRRVIVEIMVTSTRALGPIEVFDLGRKEYPGLGLVTVYRTLDKLEELSLIQRVHLVGGCHMYLRATQGHQHLLICSNCGRIVYFSGDDLTGLLERVTLRTGFQVKDHWLQLFGLCPDCQAAIRHF